MVLEAVWILHYQMKSGVLFQDIGLLLTVFMAGLAGGAIAVDRLRGRPFAGRLGLPLVAGLCAASALTAYAVGSDRLATLLAAGAGLGATGFLVAAVFAHASAGGGDQGRLISPLYAADLAGGCAGAVLGGLLAIPIIGLAMTSVLMIFAAAASVAFLGRD